MSTDEIEVEETESEDIQVAQTPKKPLWRKILGRFIKISLFLIVVIFIMLTVLSRLGGNGDIYRETIEEFLTNNTPYTAKVSTLNNMKLFPDLITDVQGLDLREGDGGLGESAITVESAIIKMSFFDMLYRPGNFKSIDIRKMHIARGAIWDQDINLDFIKVIQEDSGSYLTASGTLSADKKTPLLAKIKLNVNGPAHNPTYKISTNREIELLLGDIEITGNINQTNTREGFRFENVTISVNQQKALRGYFDIIKDDDSFGIKGQARIEPHKSVIEFDLHREKEEGQKNIWSGSVNSSILQIADFNAEKPFIKAISKTMDVIDIKLENIDADIDLSVQSVQNGALVSGALESEISMQESVLSASNINGNIMDGTLTGDMTIDFTQSPPTLNTILALHNFDAVNFAINGNADMSIDIKSQGENLSELQKNSSGKFIFVSGNAEINSAAIANIREALFSKLPANDNLAFTCMIINADIANQKARSDAMFLKSPQANLQAEGTYSWSTDMLDLLVESESGQTTALVGNLMGNETPLQASTNNLGRESLQSNQKNFLVRVDGLSLAEGHPCTANMIERISLPPLTPQTPAAQPESEPEPKSEPITAPVE